MAKDDTKPAPEDVNSAWKQYLAEKNLPTNGQVIFNKTQTELVSRSTKGVSAWLESPAQLKLLARAHKALIKVAKLRKMDVNQVKAVRAARLENTDLVFIFPVPDTHPEAIEVQYYSDHHWINLRSLLEEHGRLLPVRHNKRFALRQVGSDSPVGHALFFDLTAPLEHTVDPPRKTKAAKKQDQSGPNQVAAGEQFTEDPNA